MRRARCLAVVYRYICVCINIYTRVSTDACICTLVCIDIYIYIYATSAALSIVCRSPLPIDADAAAGAMGRKAKMKPHTAQLLDRALKECEGSEENVRRIYNTLVTNPEEQIQPTLFQRFVRRRLDPIQACYSEERFPTLAGAEDSIVLLPRWRALMEWQVQASPTWASALEECLQMQQDAAVHPILYTADITCGNILAPVKSKKISAFYVGLREMKPHLHCQSAWLIAGAVQQAEVEKIEGGLSAIVARLVRQIFSEENMRGFTVALPAGPKHIRIGSPGHFLADHDAQRAAYAAKGSAAVSPCVHCCNVHKKDIDSVPGWCSILEH